MERQGLNFTRRKLKVSSLRKVPPGNDFDEMRGNGDAKTPEPSREVFLPRESAQEVWTDIRFISITQGQLPSDLNLSILFCPVHRSVVKKKSSPPDTL